MEIERKFLVKRENLPENLEQYPSKAIEQGYLCTEPVVRIRKSNDNYYLTYKSKGLLGGIVEHRGLPDPAAAVEDRCIAEIHFFTGLYHRDRLNRRLDRYLHRLDCSRLLHDRGHRYLWLGLRRCLYHRLHDRGRLSGDRKARCAAPLLHTRNRKTLALCRLIGGPFGLCGLAWFRGRLLGLRLPWSTPHGSPCLHSPAASAWRGSPDSRRVSRRASSPRRC